ncbi:MAG: hypothetical protein WC307_02860 [Candidatus Nanoarchaeia archaeon]|jgi:hypothetical protein
MKNQLLITLLIVMLAGCTQTSTKEPSSINITSSRPVAGATINDSALIYVDVEYSVGNYNTSASYFIEITLLREDSEIMLPGLDEIVTSATGTATNLFIDTDMLGYLDENEDLSYPPPYEFKVSLNKRLTGMTYTQLANTTITYQG